MVTLKQIAEACGMSITQVSRALNDHLDVSEKSKKRILRVANEMGYVKNLFASSLVNRTSNMIAVIIEGAEADNVDPLSLNIYQLQLGISEAASTANLEPFIYLKKRSTKLDYVNFCKQRYASGLIIFGSYYDSSEYIALQNSDFPSVSIDMMSEGPFSGSVVINNVFYSKTAVSQLIDNGCKKIAIICGSKSSYVTHERLSGYQIALSMNNIPYNEDLVYYADYNSALASVATKELLKNHPDTDGIFCMSDQMAISCIETLKALNKDVPKDIKVFGFDGMYLGNIISPSLSTIEQDFKLKGIAAVRLLSNIIRGEQIEKTIIIPCHAIFRESSAANNDNNGRVAKPTFMS